MATNGTSNKNGKGKAPVLVVVQMTGGNDFMNTLVPYTSGMYHDMRPVVGVSEDRVLPINDTLIGLCQREFLARQSVGILLGFVLAFLERLYFMLLRNDVP